MKYGCIGEKLGHSFSREIHRGLAPYDYELREIPREDLPAFLKARDFAGINVTIPYKEAVIPYLDEISPEAIAIGAVNTVVNRGGRLSGHNTDLFGMRALLERTGISLSGKKVLILGTGGTSKTARYLAKTLGAREILRVSRTAREDALTYEEVLASHRDAEVILNTTPCGMFPHPGETPLSPGLFPDLSGAMDAIYNPLRSRFVQEAAALGIPAAGGLYMLVAQAAFAAGIFLGEPIPAEKTERVYREILKQKQNIVLVGMPSSGKSTLGEGTAKALDRPFFDTDKEAVRLAGKPIPEIFAREGEGAFRDLESRVIADLSQKNGLVLATGGGAVLREENRRALRSNGFVVFLDRPLSFLQATSDRPLSSNRTDLERLYRERREAYLAAADFVFRPGASVEETVNEIIKEWNA